MWQPNTDHSVAPIRWPQDRHKWWLTFACNEALSRKLQNQYKRWLDSDYSKPPPNQLHNRHTQRADLAGTRAPLKLLPTPWGQNLHNRLSTVVTARPHRKSAWNWDLCKTQLFLSIHFIVFLSSMFFYLLTFFHLFSFKELKYKLTSSWNLNASYSMKSSLPATHAIEFILFSCFHIACAII